MQTNMIRVPGSSTAKSHQIMTNLHLQSSYIIHAFYC